MTLKDIDAAIDELLTDFMWAFTVSSSAEKGKAESKAKLKQLIIEVAEGCLPEKQALQTDTDEDDIADFGEPHNFCVDCGQYEVEGKLDCKCVGYNQAIEATRAALEKLGER